MSTMTYSWIRHDGLSDVNDLNSTFVQLSSVSSLFLQFSHGGGLGCLIGIYEPSRKFDADSLDWRAILKDLERGNRNE